jgi:MFS family permease
MIGAFLAPMAAGTQAAEQGWRWSYYSLAICLSILSVMFLVAFEETKYIPITVGQTDDTDEASSERPESKDAIDEKTKIEKVTSIATQLDTNIPMNTWRQRLRLVTTTSESLPKLFMMPLYVITLPHVMFTALQFASGVCWLVVFMQVTSIVFSAPPYLFTTAGVGYMALGPFVGNVFGSIYGGPFADWAIVRLARRNGGYFEPEMRLYPLVIPTIFMAGGIIMFGVTADRVSIHTHQN